jgi:DNA topoisomerase-1
VNSIPIGSDAEGRAVVARVGRYGPYLQRDDDRASIPEDLPPDELTLERAEELLSAPSGDRTLGNHPEEDLPVIARTGRFGPYVQLGEAVDGGDKPRTASLFKSMALDTVTLDEAVQLLRLPRSVGTDPATSEEVLALNGRFGPYLKRGADTRSLTGEEELFTVTMDEAVALFAQPKKGRGRTTAAPLKELGEDPDTKQPIVLRAGRFGPYVTDGTTNASLRQGDDEATITHERAVELLADRRAAGPPVKRAKKAAKSKKAAKKTTAKKTTAKKAGGATKAAKAGTVTKAKKATAAAGGAAWSDDGDPGLQDPGPDDGDDSDS